MPVNRRRYREMVRDDETNPVPLCDLNSWSGDLPIVRIRFNRDVRQDVPANHGGLKRKDFHAIFDTRFELAIAARIDWCRVR